MDKTDHKPTKVLVSVVLDRSGSMGSTKAGTISGYNEYLQGLRADTATNYEVTLVQFDAPLTSPELTISYQDKPLADVPDLTAATYVPRGNTPLYDAIGECVRRTEAGDRGVIMVIITDGMENASLEFTRDSVKALIKAKEAEGWTFAFLGANIDSYSVSGSIGMSAGSASNYVQGHEHTMYANVAQATATRSEAMRSHGVVGSSRMMFFNEEQKLKMEHPDQNSTGAIPHQTTSGGGTVVQPNFPANGLGGATIHSSGQIAPVARKRRDWKVASNA